MDNETRSLWRRIEHRAEWLGFWLVQRLLPLLPLRAAVAVGAAFGRLAYRLGIRRRVVAENLTRAFPDWSLSQRRTVARQAYCNVGRFFAECICLQSLAPQTIDAMVDGIDGQEHLDRVGGTGKPFVVVTAHVDNWELMGAFFIRRGFRLCVIAKPLHNPYIEASLAKSRRAVGLEVIYTGEGMKPVTRHLREGGVLAVLADQDARKQGLAVPFFDHPASTAPGPAVIAWLARVPLLPVFPYRVGPSRHRFRFFPPIEFTQGEDRDRALESMTRQHVGALEEFVREHPADYFWFHRRWKTPPHKIGKKKK